MNNIDRRRFNAMLAGLGLAGWALREEGRDYLSGVTAFRTAVPSSFACSSMAASCFFTYSDWGRGFPGDPSLE